MNAIDSVSRSSQILTHVLRSSLQQSTDIAEKILKAGTQEKMDISKLEYMGNFIDTYA